MGSFSLELGFYGVRKQFAQLCLIRSDKKLGRKKRKCKEFSASHSWRSFIIDPLGRPTIQPVVITIFAHGVCTSVRPSPLFKINRNQAILSENSDRYWPSGSLITHVLLVMSTPSPCPWFVNSYIAVIIDDRCFSEFFHEVFLKSRKT